MARIKIEIPGKPIGSVNIPVRITDINYGNHVGNDSIVSIIHEARAQWLKSFNYSEMDMAGVSSIMSDLAVEYKRESLYGDVLEITLYAGEISRVGFDLFYTLETNRNGNKLLIAKAKTGIVCFDYENKKVVTVPEKLKTILVG